jgi:hypothetical protein
MAQPWTVEILYSNGYSKTIVCRSFDHACEVQKEASERSDVTYAKIKDKPMTEITDGVKDLIRDICEADEPSGESNRHVMVDLDWLEWKLVELLSERQRERPAVPDGWNLYVTNGDMGPFIHIKAPDGRGAGEALHSSGFGSLVEEMLAAPPADTVEQNHVIDGVCPKHNLGGGPCYCYPLRPVARIADDEGSGVPE